MLQDDYPAPPQENACRNGCVCVSQPAYEGESLTGRLERIIASLPIFPPPGVSLRARQRCKQRERDEVNEQKEECDAGRPSVIISVYKGIGTCIITRQPALCFDAAEVFFHLPRQTRTTYLGVKCAIKVRWWTRENMELMTRLHPHACSHLI